MISVYNENFRAFLDRSTRIFRTAASHHVSHEPFAEKPHHSLRSRFAEEPPDPNAKRFDIFLIDSCWNNDVSNVVRARLKTLYEHNLQDSLYILTEQQSIAVLRNAPEAIGHDPIIVVYDLFVSKAHKSSRYRGFRLNLGLIKNPEQALSRLQEFVRFVAMNRRAIHLESEIRKELHREGLDGMVKIFREASLELL